MGFVVPQTSKEGSTALALKPAQAKALDGPCECFLRTKPNLESSSSAATPHRTSSNTPEIQLEVHGYDPRTLMNEEMHRKRRCSETAHSSRKARMLGAGNPLTQHISSQHSTLETQCSETAQSSKRQNVGAGNPLKQLISSQQAHPQTHAMLRNCTIRQKPECGGRKPPKAVNIFTAHKQTHTVRSNAQQLHNLAQARMRGQETP